MDIIQRSVDKEDVPIDALKGEDDESLENSAKLSMGNGLYVGRCGVAEGLPADYACRW
jgi:hypothetical protein